MKGVVAVRFTYKAEEDGAEERLKREDSKQRERIIRLLVRSSTFMLSEISGSPSALQMLAFLRLRDAHQRQGISTDNDQVFIQLTELGLGLGV